MTLRKKTTCKLFPGSGLYQTVTTDDNIDLIDHKWGLKSVRAMGIKRFAADHECIRQASLLQIWEELTKIQMICNSKQSLGLSTHFEVETKI